MARVQLVLTDEDKDRYTHQARKAGKSLNAWLREAASEKLVQSQNQGNINTVEELRAFYRVCDENIDIEREPDWEDHKKVIETSKSGGSSNT